MTREDEIQARLDAATPGTWEIKHNQNHEREIHAAKSHCIARLLHQCVIGIQEQADKDAELIAHAPDDLAYLLKENAKKDAEISRFGAAIIHTYTVNYIQGLEKENSMLVGEIVRLENLVMSAEQSDSLAQPSPNKYVETESATHVNDQED